MSVAVAVLAILAFLGWVITLLGVVLWIVLMVKAYQGTSYKVPWAGNLAEKWAGQQGK